MDPRSYTTCRACGALITQLAKGRWQRYCSAVCRQRWYRQRQAKWRRVGP